ncbi:response regulator [Novosphingobium olei]|uniref:Response regulator transcription factor n=1 Tax=Novosphingobium olei TaxID=2728851 RepID=A0A7Y0GAV6_9SPHN|nr:response regulator transcription factor [Novosphingobium olei]
MTGDGTSPSLIIVEDDPAFARTLSRSFERRGYAVQHADSPDRLVALLDSHDFEFAVVDLKLGTVSGLPCVEMIHARDPQTRIVVLTGFASIATAVEAIKLGAAHYLAKPANTDDIEEAFGRATGDANVPIDGRKSSIKTVEWEYIHTTLAECDFNISETARRLGMHRRTLARKLEKRQLR